MPLVDLLNNRVTSRYNVLIGKYEMTFDILMWSVEAKQAIYHHLKEEGRSMNYLYCCKILSSLKLAQCAQKRWLGAKPI